VIATVVTLAGLQVGVSNEQPRISGTGHRTVDRYIIGSTSIGTATLGVPVHSGSGIPNSTMAPEPVTTNAPVLTPTEDFICSYAWECRVALYIARCEAGPDYTAGDNATSGARGTFQIHPIHKGLVKELGYTWEQMLELEPNVAVAFQLYLSPRGWSHWDCY